MVEQYYGLTAEMYRAVVALVDDRMEEIRLTRQDFDRLEEAQGRVEERMKRVEAALERLAQAQARTEERVGRLEEGQAAMQAAIQELARVQTRLSQEIGGLREDIGFGLEDVARLLLPPYLHKHYGIQLEGPPGEELQRRFFPMKDRPTEEINLYGEGWRDRQQVVVLGESKARIGGGVVSEFAEVLERVEPLVKGEVWRVMFGYFIHPSAQPVAEKHRILLVASYQR